MPVFTGPNFPTNGYSPADAPVGVEFWWVQPGISMTTAALTDTNLFVAARKCLITYASAITTTVTGYSSAVLPAWHIRDSAASATVSTNSPIGNSASWNAVDLVTTATLSGTAGNRVISVGATVQFRNINQNGSTAFVVTSIVKAMYVA